MSAGASSYGPPCSRGGQSLRGMRQQQHLDTREGLLDQQLVAFNQHDANSQRALVDAQELYASAEAQANIFIRQEEDLTVCVRVVNEQEVKLLEQEELDHLTLNRELDGLATHESTLDRPEATLEMERKALEDARLNVLARELATEAREADLRVQEVGLAVQEWQLAERLKVA
jgi:hypothetical protein